MSRAEEVDAAIERAKSEPDFTGPGRRTHDDRRLLAEEVVRLRRRAAIYWQEGYDASEMDGERHEYGVSANPYPGDPYDSATERPL